MERSPSIGRDARGQDGASNWFPLRLSLYIERRERKGPGVALAVTRHRIDFVQGKDSCRRSGVARGERPPEVVKLHSSWAGLLPRAKTDISLHWIKKHIFKLRPVAVPLVKALIEHLPTCGVDHAPQPHDGIIGTLPGILLTASGHTQHRQFDRTSRARS